MGIFFPKVYCLKITQECLNSVTSFICDRFQTPSYRARNMDSRTRSNITENCKKLLLAFFSVHKFISEPGKFYHPGNLLLLVQFQGLPSYQGDQCQFSYLHLYSLKPRRRKQKRKCCMEVNRVHQPRGHAYHQAQHTTHPSHVNEGKG